jgi:hypothetical protein
MVCKKSHRNCTSLAHILAQTHGRATALGWVVETVCIRLWTECFVRAHITDRTRALVCEACKRECLPHVQDFCAVDLVAQEWIASRVRRGPVCGSERLGGDLRRGTQDKELQTHLCRDVLIKVSGILRIVKVRAIRSGIPMYA